MTSPRSTLSSSPDLSNGRVDSSNVVSSKSGPASPPTSPKPPSPPSTAYPIPRPRPAHTHSTGSFVSSPLNPAAQSPPIMSSQQRYTFASRPSSRTSSQLLQKLSPEEPPPLHSYPSYNSSLPSGVSTPAYTPSASIGARASIILYRIADPTTPLTRNSVIAASTAVASPATTAVGAAPLPRLSKMARESVMSSRYSFAASTFQDSDSKYPVGIGAQRGGALVPYEYDPAFDLMDPPDEEDFLHDPEYKVKIKRMDILPWRGVLNIAVLSALISGLLCLFVFYPVWAFFRDRERNDAMASNTRINATGQAPVLFQMPEMIDKETPHNARTRTGYDGQAYELVFSDEFNVDGRTFYAGDDPFWEAVDLWYGATGDLEWYDPSQVTTRDGKLVITMDSVTTGEPGLTPGSTAPFTPLDNHNMNYRSGMLQTWNKFCFTTGYIEVSVMLPGPDQNTQGLWPGIWTMGNLARPGYPATTDGVWPYTYSTCDVGTFPNQTDRDGLGPTAALHSDSSRSKYDFELSWLSGQRLSACSCPGSDHPGPDVTVGRGAPEIDVFEAEKDKNYEIGQVVSQSAQFAPFSHDYVYDNSSDDLWMEWEYPTLDGIPRTRRNSYQGSAVQQSVSALTRLPEDMFQGSGRAFRTFGFEWWSNPDDPLAGSVSWQVDGKRSYRLGAGAVGPDMGATGSQVGQRLIPLEPMSIVLNLGMSENWQPIDEASLMFPSEFMIDYVRVYQRSDSLNFGCNPDRFPTTDYIDRHKAAYQDNNMTVWPGEKPRNRLYEGGC